MLKNAPKNAPDTKSEILKKVPKMTKIVEKLASKNGTKFSEKIVRVTFFFQNFAFRKKSLHRNFTVREHPWGPDPNTRRTQIEKTADQKGKKGRAKNKKQRTKNQKARKISEKSP